MVANDGFYVFTFNQRNQHRNQQQQQPQQQQKSHKSEQINKTAKHHEHLRNEKDTCVKLTACTITR